MLGVELNDRQFCIGYSIFAYFNLSYECIGSLGMAIFRILYLKVSSLNYLGMAIVGTLSGRKVRAFFKLNIKADKSNRR